RIVRHSRYLIHAQLVSERKIVSRPGSKLVGLLSFDCRGGLRILEKISARSGDTGGRPTRLFLENITERSGDTGGRQPSQCLEKLTPAARFLLAQRICTSPPVGSIIRTAGD